MDDYALILNAGSSSLKFCVFQRSLGKNWRLEAHGQIEGIGTSPRLSVKNEQGTKIADDDVPVKNGKDAIEALAGWLRSKYGGSRVVGVGHRVVHGGAHFKGPTIVTPDVIAKLRELIPLAPLHQPHNVAAIEAVAERLPDVKQVACFDTSFHRTQSPVVELIPFPKNLRDAGIQRYGFHGLSYEYIASALPEAAPEIASARVIVAHMGSGASMCAMKAGKGVDCTFGFAPLDGLCMGTRPGTIDPGVVLHLMQGVNYSAKDIESLLYKKSGLLGISGISNDMRDLLGRPEPEAKLAIDYFVWRAAKEIGALAASLGGVDAIVFTAGIGENSPEIRRRICEASKWLGVSLDTKANESRQIKISSPQSKVSVWVIPTNEELMIARHTATLLHLR
jgi:acetate kinase